MSRGPRRSTSTEPSFTQASRAVALRRLARGQDDVVARAEHRRREDEGIVAVLGGCAAEDGDDRRSPRCDRPARRRRRARMERGSRRRPRAAPAAWRRRNEPSDRGDVEVGPDPAGGGEEQGATALSGCEPLDVGRDEIVQPGTGIGTPHGDHAPPGELREGAAGLERVQFRRSRSGHSSRRRHRSASTDAAWTPATLWEDIGPVEIPRTLVVTNDFPPRVGGIQRTLESLCRELPADEGLRDRPFCEGSEAFDAIGGRSTSSGSGVGSCGRRPRSPIGSRPRSRGPAREVVLFGDAFPLALLGPRLASRGTSPPSSSRTGSTTGSPPCRSPTP